ncbi:hypothetical protein D0Z07_2212 [Hyphodiscus hymeniophilus]|uniref:Fungal N-terminal domain-containing protein n=1 Tax=Hyphodiscus hymeniophilus TaxID=353542 RepID=A0A9P6VN85_9HELO|nr:hypothetical protein D0Z07_2212 [Hyphodiscus hymeniophilus]
MAEAIGLGASVIAFVGIAGQAVQGCQYIRDVLNDIQDAPDDLRSLCSEIKLFELNLQGLQHVLQHFADSGVPIEAGGHGLATRLALEYSKETVAKLFEFVTKLSQARGRWRRFRFALGKTSCGKNVARMERAKSYLAVAQANILLSVEHQQVVNTRATHNSLGALTSSLDTSAGTIATIPSRFDEVILTTQHTSEVASQLRNDVSKRLHDLSTGINAILTSNFRAFSSMISETRARVEEVHHSVQQTQGAVEHMRTTSEGLAWLPLGMAEAVKITLRGVLVEFYYERKKLLQTEEAKQNEEVARSTFPSPYNHRRRILSHYTHSRRYIRAVGVITVTSTTTIFRQRVDSEDEGTEYPTTSTVTQTNLQLNPSPGLLRMGVYGSFVEQGFATFNPSPEFNLKTFTVIDTDSPIVQACCLGNLAEVQGLFAAKQASPFDRVWGERSLLDLVLLQAISAASSQSEASTLLVRMTQLVDVYDYLVSQGLDPGIPRSNKDPYGPSPLSALALLAIRMNGVEKHGQCSIRLARIILKHSIHDPFEDADFRRVVWLRETSVAEQPLLVLFQTQEEWPVKLPDLDTTGDSYCARISDSCNMRSSSNLQGLYTIQGYYTIRYGPEGQLCVVFPTIRYGTEVNTLMSFSLLIPQLPSLKYWRVVLLSRIGSKHWSR